ncbi:MAG: hypothetical protein ACI4IS_00555 [Acutalibacteraceae bacterium]
MENKTKRLSLYGKKSVLLSVIALFEIVALALVASFAWIENGPAELGVNNFTIRSEAGFNFFNEDGEAVNELIIKADGELSDCSTVDGRRLYFPILGEADGSTAANAPDGSKLVYRAATEIDQKKYITVNFQVISVSNQDIEVYIDPSSEIKNNSVDLTAARITFNTNDGEDPVTVRPGSDNNNDINRPCLQLVGNEAKTGGTTTYKAMNLINSSKEPDNANAPTVFTLPKNKVKTITMTVWLDGFDSSCQDSIVGMDNTKLSIKFGVRSKKTTT